VDNSAVSQVIHIIFLVLQFNSYLSVEHRAY
jgi:hypothetical protein